MGLDTYEYLVFGLGPRHYFIRRTSTSRLLPPLLYSLEALSEQWQVSLSLLV